MKKNFFAILLLICLICMAFILASCDGKIKKFSDSGDDSERETQFEPTETQQKETVEVLPPIDHGIREGMTYDDVEMLFGEEGLLHETYPYVYYWTLNTGELVEVEFSWKYTTGELTYVDMVSVKRYVDKRPVIVTVLPKFERWHDPIEEGKFYAQDFDNHHFYEVIWEDALELDYEQTVTVEFSEVTEITYFSYRDGGYTPSHIVVAESVK